MKTFFADEQSKHSPDLLHASGAKRPNPEVPLRSEILLQGARDAGSQIHRPRDFGLGPLSAVHTPEYLEFLATIHERWQHVPGAARDILPSVHPVSRDHRYPRSVVGQVGYHVVELACPIGAQTWESACWSAWSAVAAAEAVLEGDSVAYALSRPPGHHAFRDAASGFCFLNNAGIAAQYLRRFVSKVAILDIDLHHGNGTQALFYDRSDILTVSVHADPEAHYPFFLGYADERGEGAGTGYNFNVPLPQGTTLTQYAEALGAALNRILFFAPDILVIALGLDISEHDPLARFLIDTSGFAKIAEAIGKLNIPTVIVQEGGYVSDVLASNLRAFLSAYASR